jgi:hypothetical protein
MAVAAVQPPSSGSNSLVLASGPIPLLRRALMGPSLSVRPPRSVRRLPAMSPGDPVPAQSRIILRGHTVSFR